MGRAHGTRRCAKRIYCRSGNGGFAACSGRKSTGTFFSLYALYLFINSSFFFLLLCLDQWTQHDQTNIFFFLETGGGAFCPILVLKNAPGTLQTPRGRYFGIILWDAPGGVYSVLYGMHIPRIHLQGHHGMFTMSVLYHHTSSPPTVQHAH